MRALSVLCLVLAAAAAQAQTMYVSDQLVITMRTGPSTQNAIIRNLRSGDRVEILEENEAGNYARVRVAGSDAEGWVLTQYLIASPAAAERLASAQRELSAAGDRIAELETEIEAADSALTAMRDRLESAESDVAGLTAEVEDIRAASANAIAARDENRELRGRVNELGERIVALDVENADLRSHERQRWFLIGAAVLLLGLLMGLIAPSLRSKKRSGW